MSVTHLREQIVLDLAHLRATLKRHFLRFRFLYIAGLTLFWPLALLFLFAPAYGVLMQEHQYLVGFGCGVVLLGVVGLRLVNETSDFLVSTTGIDERRRCLLLYAISGAIPALPYLAVAAWAPSPLVVAGKLLTLAATCASILLAVVLGMLQTTLRLPPVTVPWWCSRELLLAPVACLPLLVDRPSALVFAVAAIVFGVRHWLLRHQFLLSATRHAPEYWYAVMVIAFGAAFSIIAPGNAGIAILSIAALGCLGWYQYGLFRFAFLLTALVAALDAAG